MKKFISSVLASLFILTTATACGGETAKQPAVNEVADGVLKEITIPSAVKKETSDISTYYTIDDSKLEEGVLYICGSGAFPDELAVLKMKDANAAKEAKAAAEKRLSSQISLFESYTPNEMYKLNDARILVKSNYVIFIATENNARAEEIVNSYF
jgi:hypothetical protein